jgi:hypothetical protein
VILLIGSLPNALGFIPHGSSVRRSSCRTGNVCGHPNSSRLRSHVSKVGSGYRRTTSVRVGVPRYADDGGTLSRARRDRRAGRSEAQDLSPLPLQPPHARPSFLGSPFRLLRRCRTSPSRCANHHRPRQAPLTDRGRGPSLRERGRDDTESLIWPRSRAPRSRRDPRVSVAKGSIPHRRRSLLGAIPRMLRPMLKACDIPYPGSEGGSKRPSGPGGANNGRIHLSVRPPDSPS